MVKKILEGEFESDNAFSLMNSVKGTRRYFPAGTRRPGDVP